ncbi:MAG: hypothetical protein CMM07_25785 [Rhodopirellula sp.]|nr:hypothetical protein [Rhodopirellula sp.]
MAYAAGFRKAGERTTANTSERDDQFLGMSIVEMELMPEGWLGLRSQKGCMLMGPNGQAQFVPFYSAERNLLQSESD